MIGDWRKGFRTGTENVVRQIYTTNSNSQCKAMFSETKLLSRFFFLLTEENVLTNITQNTAFPGPLPLAQEK